MSGIEDSCLQVVIRLRQSREFSASAPFFFVARSVNGALPAASR